MTLKCTFSSSRLYNWQCLQKLQVEEEEDEEDLLKNPFSEITIFSFPMFSSSTLILLQFRLSKVGEIGREKAECSKISIE